MGGSTNQGAATGAPVQLQPVSWGLPGGGAAAATAPQQGFLAKLFDPKTGGPQALASLGQALIAAGGPVAPGQSRFGNASPYLSAMAEAPTQAKLRQFQLDKLEQEAAAAKRKAGLEAAQRNNLAALFGGTDAKGITWNGPRPGMTDQTGGLTGQGRAALYSAYPEQAAETLFATQKSQAMIPLEVQKAGAIAAATEAAREPYQTAAEKRKAALEIGTERAKNPVLAERARLQAEAELPAKRDLAETQAGVKSGQQDFQRGNTLRDEFNTLTKDFRTVQDAYSKIKSVSPSGAGDMSLLYAYVKLLDPGSVVRESEFATAAASGSFGQQVQGAVQRILSGERLPESLRGAFLSEAENIYKAQKQGYDRTKANYSTLAGRYKLDPALIVQDYAAPTAQPTAAPAQGGGANAGRISSRVVTTGPYAGKSAQEILGTDFTQLRGDALDAYIDALGQINGGQ